MLKLLHQLVMAVNQTQPELISKTFKCHLAMGEEALRTHVPQNLPIGIQLVFFTIKCVLLDHCAATLLSNLIVLPPLYS